MNNVAGVGKQVLSELGDVAKKTAQETVGAGADILKGVVEQGGEQAKEEQAGTNTDPMQQIKQQSAIKKQKSLQRVRQELADYVNKKKQEDDHEEMVGESQEEFDKQEEEQIKESERDFQVDQAQRGGGGTGEMSRKKG